VWWRTASCRDSSAMRPGSQGPATSSPGLSAAGPRGRLRGSALTPISRRARRNSSPASPDCWRSTGGMETDRSWWTRISRACCSAPPSIPRSPRSTARSSSPSPLAPASSSRTSSATEFASTNYTPAAAWRSATACSCRSSPMSPGGPSSSVAPPRPPPSAPPWWARWPPAGAEEDMTPSSRPSTLWGESGPAATSRTRSAMPSTPISSPTMSGFTITSAGAPTM